ncbi:hypothetical protein RN001_008643 [Aquatica leii]|uniref:Major facilitator superfamily (MFS) profile domain-containing protein n=1 Tax=Aquatica leii TaxID=1421715 RepID=A0AAN7P9W3_9COLE|nr:hypothetical protein RN001_008643 [Aquatica leii]
MDYFYQSQIFSGRLSQLIAVLTGSLTALSDGMQYGWSSPALSVLQSPSSPIKFEDWHMVWLENLYMLGGLFGLPLTIYLLDKFGRTATSIELLFFARFLAGFGADVNFMATPTYIAEIADKQIRGRLGSIIYIMMLLGILLIYSVGPFVSIAASSAIGASVIIIQLMTFSFMPKSPYYLLVKNNVEGARKSLQILRPADEVEDELREIAEVIKKENEERGRPLDLFKVKSYRKAFLIMTVLNVGQHFSGISVMLMNIHMILEDAASIISVSTAAIIFSALMLISCIMSAILIDKAGRKFLLYTSSFLTGISLLILASYFAAKNANVDVSSYNWLSILSVMLYAICFKLGLGLVPIVMTAELYPTNIKALGCAVADAMYIIGGGVSIFLFYALLETYGLEVPFFLFGFCCLFVGVFSIFVIPETKGRSLEEIQQMLKGNSITDTEKINLLSSTGNGSYNVNYE